MPIECNQDSWQGSGHEDSHHVEGMSENKASVNGSPSQAHETELESLVCVSQESLESRFIVTEIFILIFLLIAFINLEHGLRGLFMIIGVNMKGDSEKITKKTVKANPKTAMTIDQTMGVKR